jgi:hypothetical protein
MTTFQQGPHTNHWRISSAQLSEGGAGVAYWQKRLAVNLETLGSIPHPVPGRKGSLARGGLFY